MIGLIVMAAMVVCLVAGGYIGWLIGSDRAEQADAEIAAQFAAIPAPGRHRTAELRRLPDAPKAAAPSTAAMFARLEAEVAPRTIPVQSVCSDCSFRATCCRQPGLGHLVRPAAQHRPGRATDFIQRLEADTDRFIATLGTGRCE